MQDPIPRENLYANVAHLQQVAQQQQHLQQQQQQQQQQQSGQMHLQQGQQTVIHPPPSSTPTPRFPDKNLPAYRPSPDYETVMRRRMERMAQQHQQNIERMNNAANLANIAHAQVYNQPEDNGLQSTRNGW